ncbi:hypothetical protein [Streptomyces clavuligerus]|uniref:Uncharacterized protein n=1 Tax=Streptomyces clavuligerus TaxID=1901 RepID=B5GYM3_STRCL|nr:hypothetical protein [Streptomyces clavuligerus]ANW20776.1 hypothetical protein BB341_22480 [Streptomyces clavuligerus]AXU15402.1 hypothetical protein D1794_23375 [Streptomyces clavuligerus]EDY51419.1 hypothetical protein SSCG_04577 [Streptomyces clavuligerus]EFG06189.1 Hypothetical protein SCLAV_1110 [Streptomyces clavuligerus]MBY6305496.1 hypothetical protein [Streptomyces clavuligerus]
MLFLILLLPTAWFAWNVWNVVQLFKALGERFWTQPMWWVRALSVSLFLGAAAWLFGAVPGGLDVAETCVLNHHQAYDSAYRSAHSEDFDRLFPLSNKCNASYDLVPAWVNPTVAACFAIAVLSVIALGCLGVSRASAAMRGEPRS